MNCPVCDERLRTVEKYGLEIDLCPGCKGMWLDRGKLEAILSQAVAQPVEAASNAAGVPTASAGPEAAPNTASVSTAPAVRATVPVFLPPAYRHDDHDHDDHHDRDDHDDHRGQLDHQSDQPQVGRRKRRGSLLGDLLGAFGGDD
jgi:hypothetical protein